MAIEKIKLFIVIDNGQEIPIEMKNIREFDMEQDVETGSKTCVIKWDGHKEE